MSNIFESIKKQILKPIRKKAVKTLGKQLGVIDKNTELWFGKYKGLVVKNILDVNPGYIVWLMDNTTLVFDQKTQIAAREGKLRVDGLKARSSRDSSYGNDWDGDWQDSWEGVCGDPWSPRGPW